MAVRARRPPLGQHFLRDSTVLRRLTEALAPGPNDYVLEIGPGQGALTEFLLSTGAAVTAIEIDAQLAAGLRKKFGGDPLTVIEGDVLNLDFSSLPGLDQGRKALVAGNLPYYITSPILRAIFNAGARVERAVLLMQEEVARRVVAGPGGRDYGLLSVLAELAAEREYLFRVKPGAFQPAPKVQSAAVRLTPRGGEVPHPTLIAFLKSCFRQPRKTLRNNLSTRYPPARLVEHQFGGFRAQQLSLADLTRLRDELEATRANEGER